MTLEELRAALEAAQATFETLTADEDATLTEEQATELDAAMASIQTLPDQIAEAEAADRTERIAATRTAITAGVGRRTTPETLGAGDVRVGEHKLAEDPTGGFNDAGHFFSAVAQSSMPGSSMMEDQLQRYSAVSGMSQGTGSDGGFLVPPAFSTAIWDGMRTSEENLLSRTDQYTIPTGTDSLTFNANAETSRATGSRYGGVRGYWISEADQITSSKPKLRQVKIEPQEMAVLVYVTDKLLRNGGSALDQFVTRAATSEIVFLTSDAIMDGDGVGKPVGIIGHNATVTVAKETNQATATIKKENIDKMWSRCFAPARARATWFINQDCEPQLEQLSAVVGTGGVPVYIPAGGITDSPNARLKGRPVVISEHSKTLGTVGDIVLADYNAYASGVRGGIRTDLSMHLRFDYAETAFRFMYEADGQPWMAEELTPFNGTDTLAPFVELATRA